MTRGRATCRDFPELSVSDDPADRQRLERHAAGCVTCAARLELHDGVVERARRWVDEAPEPSPELRRRVLAAYRERAASLAETATDGREPPGRLLGFPERAGRRSRRAGWLAAAAVLAASLATVAVLLAPSSTPAPETARGLLVSRALEEAVEAERAHARAIERLEEAAAPLLARADDPGLPAHEASRLLAIRDRLAYLDSTIAEIRLFLDDNPAHPGGRTLLASAYDQKSQVLRDLLEKEPLS